MKVDERFKKYFNGRLKQVFLYITDICNLKCEHCLYKTTLAQREIDFDVCVRLLGVFRSYGAKKLTLIGGEPTLYGIKSERNSLTALIRAAKMMHYEYIRLDTNGQFDSDLLTSSNLKYINNLAFSLDGHNAQTNDKLRGKGSFEKCIYNIKRSVKQNYHVTITTCIHKDNLDYIEEVIDLATSLGAKELNLHPVLKMGIKRDDFTGDCHITAGDWYETVKLIKAKADSDLYNIPVRLPQRYIKTDEYNTCQDDYHYCPVRMGERVLVHPDKNIRICALCIGDQHHVAKFSDHQITFSQEYQEISPHRLEQYPCMNQTLDLDELTPLCISYKPKQVEYVWNNEDFDNKEKFLKLFDY